MSKWGSGYVCLRGKVWTLRTRAVKAGKVRHLRLRLGTIGELPTKKDAERAAGILKLSGIQSIVSMTRERRISERPSLPTFSKEWFEAKLIEQGGNCAICRCMPRRFVPDHDHETGYLRGLLCQQCNSGIGMLRDDPLLVRAALLYLESYSLEKAIAPNCTEEHQIRHV